MLISKLYTYIKVYMYIYISLPVYIYFIIRRIFLSLIKSSNIIIQISNTYL